MMVGVRYLGERSYTNEGFEISTFFSNVWLIHLDFIRLSFNMQIMVSLFPSSINNQ